MNPLALWRNELRPLISRGFLRRDQGDALFISDFPRHGDTESICGAIRQAGFTVTLEKDLAHIDASPEKYWEMIGNLPETTDYSPNDETLYLYSLARRLAKLDVPPEKQPLFPIRFVLKCLEGKDPTALSRHFPPLLARLQRKKEDLPAAAGKLILAALSAPGKGE